MDGAAIWLAVGVGLMALILGMALGAYLTTRALEAERRRKLDELKAASEDEMMSMARKVAEADGAVRRAEARCEADTIIIKKADGDDS